MKLVATMTELAQAVGYSASTIKKRIKGDPDCPKKVLHGYYLWFDVDAFQEYFWRKPANRKMPRANTLVVIARQLGVSKNQLRSRRQDDKRFPKAHEDGYRLAEIEEYLLARPLIPRRGQRP